MSADYALDNNRLALTRIAGRLLGGAINGDATVDNLLASSSGARAAQRPGKVSSKEGKSKLGSGESLAATEQISGPGPQHGTARLRVSAVSLAELTRTISTRSLPLESLKPAGSVAGTVGLAWMGSLSAAQGELALDIVAPSQPADGELPVSGSLRSHYYLRPQVMDIATLDLKTPHADLSAAGTVGTTSESLKVNFAATSLKEFEPFVLALGYAPSPVELEGEATFTGTVSGRLSDSQVAGHVQASNFTYVYTAPAKAAAHPVHPPSKRGFSLHPASAPTSEPVSPLAPARRIHIDQFKADVQYSLSKVAVHNAVIQEGSGRLNVDWTAALEKGSFTDDSLFQLQLAVHNADVTELQRAVGLDYPVTGMLNTSLQASGTEGNPNGTGQFTLTAAQVYGRPIKSAGADLRFVNHEAQLDHIRVQAAGGVMAGTAAYNFSNKNMRFDVSGISLNLADITELQTARLQAGGVVRFDGERFRHSRRADYQWPS